MIEIENVDVYGWKAAVRGMRNPMNSWENSDSGKCEDTNCQDCSQYGKGCVEFDHSFVVGNNDLKLMQSLVKAGTDHSKFMRMINVTLDITAPLYWWKEFDTYKVGTVRNSCSTMHKIAEKEFTLDDFSHDHLYFSPVLCNFKNTIAVLNQWRKLFNYTDKEREDYFNQNGHPSVLSKKDCWWQIIQLLPSSYNQRSTVQFNYAVLRNMYRSRKNHKLDEWRDFCKWVETLPYAKELICSE